MNNKLKRTDFFENYKLSTTLNEIFVVVGHDWWKTQHTITYAFCFDLSMENRAEFITHKLPWVFREDSQSELMLTVPTVKKPIRARSPNSGETAGYWNTIRNGVTQTSLLHALVVGYLWHECEDKWWTWEHGDDDEFDPELKQPVIKTV